MRYVTHLKFTFLIVLATTFLFSCEKLAFRTTKSGLCYKLEKKGEGPKPKNGDILSLEMTYQTKEQVVLFDSNTLGMPFNMPYKEELDKEQEGNVGEGIHMLRKGDTVICKITAKKLLGLNFTETFKEHKLEENTPIYVRIHLADIIDEELFNKQQAEKYKEMLEKEQQKNKEQLPKDIAAIKAYLEKNNNIKALCTPSGLHYKIITPGTGAFPQVGQTVYVHYTGKTLEDTVFDTSLPEIAKANGLYNEKRSYEPLSFKLGQGNTIPGFDEGVKLVKKGGKIMLFIPSVLAYRDMELGKIKPNSNLIFEIEVVDIKQE